MYTEAEARTKVCPHLPVDYETATVTDNETEQRVVNHAGCIASDCMAWRWEDTNESHKRFEREWPSVNPDVPVPERRGYCGLAGKP